MTLDENVKTFVKYISSLKFKKLIYLARKAQITLLLIEKIIISTKYLNFEEFF